MKTYPRLLLVWGTVLLWAGFWRLGIAAADAPLPPETFAGTCGAWEPVSAGAFGMAPVQTTTQPYASEEGFEVQVFAGRLYVGMEADNTFGARLWRTREGVRAPIGQADWEEVAEQDGEPFGNAICQMSGSKCLRQNDHIDSLAEFRGALYASTANGGVSTLGTLIYSSTTGAAGSWTPVITAGFGYTQNTNFKDMVVFTTTGQAWLCGGTQNWETGAQIWCTRDGITWTQQNLSGFGSVSNVLAASSGVFSGALYVGIYRDGGPGQVWRTFDLITWTQVFTAPTESLERVEIAGVLGDYLYVVAGDYAGINTTDTLRLYRSDTGAPGDWQEVGAAIGAANAHNTRIIVDGAAVYNGALYLAVMNNATGMQVWRSANGIAWTAVTTGGIGYTTTFAAQLIPYRGYLYAWTSDYVHGQQVYRTACPICQSRAISRTGSYAFAGVGATVLLTQSAGLPQTVTLCTRPGAAPTAQTTTLPVARVFSISGAPGATALLSVTYTADELAASDAGMRALYLTRWDGAAWADCPEALRTHAPLSREVACAAAPLEGTWAIAAEDAAPTHITLRRTTGGARGSLGGILGGLLLVFVGLARAISEGLRRLMGW